MRRSQRMRLGRVSLPALGAVLAALMLLPAAEAPARSQQAPQIRFDEYEIVTGPAKIQTVLPGFFRGGAYADLAVLGVEDSGDRRLRLYALRDGTWSPANDVTLSPGVLFADVARIDGRDRLILHEEGRLGWFDPASDKVRDLTMIKARFNARPGEVPAVDITRDLNGDGRDDLVIPDDEGLTVVLQLPGGVFADPMTIGPPAPFLNRTVAKESRTYREEGWSALTNPWHQDRLHEVDYDGDGRNDLVIWNGSRFEVHRQESDGTFSPQAQTSWSDVVFGADGIPMLAFRDRKAAKVLHSLRDLDGDGAADLLTFTIAGKNIFREKTFYEAHFGEPAEEGTAFAREPGATVPSDGMQVGMRLHDFDGDGDLDMMFTTVEIGIFRILGGLVSGSMPIKIEFHRMEDGVYSDKPDAVIKVRQDLDALEGYKSGSVHPSVLIGDVNGDGRSDLLMGRRGKNLRLYPGVDGPDLFASDPQEVEVAMPGDRNNDRELRIWTHGDGPWVPVHHERRARLADLNADGRDDLIVHHLPEDTDAHRVTVLIAR